MRNLLTTTEAAAALDISVRRVQALIKSGRLAAAKHGRDWHIKPVDLEKVRVRSAGRPARRP